MSEETTLVIEAGRTEKHYWLDMWRYRELFYRDVIANKFKSLGSKLFTFRHSPFTASTKELYAL